MSLLKAAQEALQAGDAAAALEYAREVLSATPANYAAAVFGGKACLALGNYQEGERLYRLAVEVDANKTPAHQGLVELYTSTGDHGALIDSLRPLVALLTGAGKAGLVRRYLTAMAQACAVAGTSTECIECWRTLTSDPLKTAPGADLEQAYEGLVAAIASHESQRVAAECRTRRSAISNLTRRTTAELEAAVTRELFISSQLDDIPARMHADCVCASPRCRQILIERMQARRSFTDVTVENLSLCAQILTASFELISSDPGNFFAHRTILEISEEDDDSNEVVVPAQMARRLWQRAAHLFPTQCDGWVGLAQLDLGSAESLDLHTKRMLRGPSGGSLSIHRCIMQAQMAWADADGGGIALQKGIDTVAVRKAKFGARLPKLQLELQLLQGEYEAAHSRHENACSHFMTVMREYSAIEDATYRSARGFVDSSVSLGKIACQGQAAEQHYCSAKDLLGSILDRNPTDMWALGALGEVHTLCGDFEDAETCLLKCIALEATSGHRQAESSLGPAKPAVAAATKKESSCAHFRLADVYWRWGRLCPEYRENKRYCHRTLLQAVKRDPTCAPVFALLAELLHRVFGDTQKAQRCLVKCIALDPTNNAASRALAQHLTAAGRHAEVAVLCKNLIALNGSDVKWAWQRLGVAQQMQNELQDSIVSLQRAVRCDTDDILSWQELANSYYLQGKYACATKVLCRVLASNTSANIAAAYRKGRLHLLLGEVDDSISIFEQLAATEWPPALVGLGDSLLRRSIAEYASGWLEQSFESLSEAVSVLQMSVRVPQLQPQRLSAWKLLGDGLLNFSYFSAPHCAKANAILRQRDGADTKSKLLCDASRIYSRLVFMKPTSTAAWHDLAVCTHERVKLAQVGAQTAVGLVAAAIKLAPCKAELWNLMGAVHTSPSLRQHAFIRALQLDDKNFTAWENLGMLYLQQSQTEPARQAFFESKRLNPSSPDSWTGLARVLEQLGKWQDAKFTYGQSLQLNPSQTEALLGYANCVAKLVNSSSVDHADLHSALAHVSQYLVLRPEDARGHILRGVFLYYLSIAKASVSAFSCALKILKIEGQKDTSMDVQLCRLNLAYACCCCGQYAAAEHEYRAIGSGDCIELTVWTSLGWALLMQGKVAAGCAAYATALESANPSEVSTFNVELQRVCIGQGHFAAAAQQCAEALLDSSIPAKCVRVALALQQHDSLQLRTAATALEDLRSLVCQGDSQVGLRQYRYLFSLVCVRMGQLHKALTTMQRVVFANPDCPRDWVIMARLLLMVHSRLVGSAVPVGQLRGICSKLTSFSEPCIARHESLDTKCWRLCTLGRLYLLLGREDEAVSALQRAVHCMPVLDDRSRCVGREAWILLALGRFLSGQHLQDISAVAATSRLLATGFRYAMSAMDRCILGLASVECDLCAGRIRAAKTALFACEAEIGKCGSGEDILVRMKALVARMKARCIVAERWALRAEDSQEGGSNNSVVDFMAHLKACSCSMASVWRELATLLPCEAGLLSLQWSIHTSPRRSERQILGVLQLAACVPQLPTRTIIYEVAGNNEVMSQFSSPRPECGSNQGLVEVGAECSETSGMPWI